MPEVRYAIRQLVKSLATLVVPAWGSLGANVAFFSVVNSVFLRPLPYQNRTGSSDALDQRDANLIRAGFSYSRYLAVREQQVFSDLSRSRSARLHRPAAAIRNRSSAPPVAAAVAGAGAAAAIGRNFAVEDSPAGPHVVPIGHAMWQARFNRDPSVLGQALTLDGAPLRQRPARSGNRNL
jgi:hypothetical protein